MQGATLNQPPFYALVVMLKWASTCFFYFFSHQKDVFAVSLEKSSHCLCHLLYNSRFYKLCWSLIMLCPCPQRGCEFHRLRFGYILVKQHDFLFHWMPPCSCVLRDEKQTWGSEWKNKSLHLLSPGLHPKHWVPGSIMLLADVTHFEALFQGVVPKILIVSQPFRGGLVLLS